MMEQTHTTKHPNYLLVAIILGVLTVAELTVASLLSVSPLKIPMLIVLSFAKGALVALYFMHLKFDSRVFSLFFGFALFLLAIPFIVVMLLVMPTGVPAGH